MVTTFYPPYHFGGDALYVQRLANELAQHGHHVEVAHCVDSYRLLAGREPGPGPADHPKVVIHRLESRWGLLSPLATQQTGRPVFKAGQLRQILDRGFDVINYHNISLVGGPQVLAYGRGIKLYTLHEYWLVCPTHILLRYGRAPCHQPHCLACTLVHGRPPQWWRYTGLLKSALRHVQAVISPSAFASQAHRERGLDMPFTVLPYFVPELPPGPGKPLAAAQTGGPYFLFVGRLEKLKGLHTLLPVFKRHGRARLLVAGAGRAAAELKRQAGDSDNIVFLGYLSPEQLAPLYREARAVIVPSLSFEVSPLVIFEAFQQAAPVIVRKIGGLPSLAAESGGGLVFDNDQELECALNRLLDEPGLRDNLGRQAQQVYRERWTPEAHLRGYLALIDRLAAA